MSGVPASVAPPTAGAVPASVAPPSVAAVAVVPASVVPPSIAAALVPPSVAVGSHSIVPVSTKPPPFMGRDDHAMARARREASEAMSKKVAASDKPCLQVCFLMDATGSMQSAINAVAGAFRAAVDQLMARLNLTVDVALVIYRDVDKDTVPFKRNPSHVIVHPFTGEGATIKTALEKTKASGGGDFPEDAAAGLLAAAELPWKSPKVSKGIIVWCTDAPGHGYDKYKALPNQPSHDAICAELLKRDLQLTFMRLGAPTDVMMAQFVKGLGRSIEQVHFDAKAYDADPKSFDPRTMFKALLATAARESMAVTPITVGVAPTLSKILWEQANIKRSAQWWSYPDIVFPSEVKDKVPLLLEILTTKDNGRLSHGMASIAMCDDTFTHSSGFRFPHTAVDNTTNGRLCVKQFKDLSEDTFEAHYRELRGHCVARVLAWIFAAKLGLVDPTGKGENLFEFTLPCVMHVADAPRGKYFTSEPFFEKGDFIKYNDNSGQYVDSLHQIPQAFSHFTWQYTAGEMMVLDVQGWFRKVTANGREQAAYFLTDPSLTTKSRETFPTSSNWGELGIQNFFGVHKCNDVCRALNLDPMV